MRDTAQLLDAAKARHSIPSDYKLAEALGVSRMLVSGYRKGKSRPDDLIAQRLADLAGLDRDVVVAELHAQRAQTPEERALWEGIAKRLQKAGLAMVAVILSAFVSGGPDGGAMAAELQSSPVAVNAGSTVHYVK